MKKAPELADEFPGAVNLIAALKEDDAAFADLVTAYSETVRRLYRIDSLIEPATDDVLAGLKARRMKMKTEIAASLAASQRAVA